MDYPGIKYLNPEACTGCRMCEMICSLIHGQNGINPRRSRIKITEKKEKGIFLPQVCQLCKEPECMRACPESALFRDPEHRCDTDWMKKNAMDVGHALKHVHTMRSFFFPVMKYLPHVIFAEVNLSVQNIASRKL